MLKPFTFMRAEDILRWIPQPAIINLPEGSCGIYYAGLAEEGWLVNIDLGRRLEACARVRVVSVSVN
jgi:hypothetical protein